MINEWDDQSSAGNNATVSPLPDVTKPVVVPNRFNGRPVMHFDGAAFLTTDHIVTHGQDYSLFVVSTLGGSYGPIYTGDPSGNGWGLDREKDLNSYGVLHGGIDTAAFGPIANPDSPQLISVTRGSGAVQYYAFGELLGRSAMGMSAPAGTTYIGAVASYSIYWGDIAEILVYDHKLSNGERIRTELYLAEKYGLYHPNAQWPWAYSSDIQDRIADNAWNKTQANACVAFASSNPAVPSQGVSLWLKADAGLKTDQNSQVTEWDDQSPNGNNATPPPGTHPPVIVRNRFNGKPAIEFDGDMYMTTSKVAESGQEYSAFLVCTLGGASGPFYNGNPGSSGWGFRRVQDLSSYGMLHGGITLLALGKTENPERAQLISVTRASGLTSFYAFGTLTGTGNATMTDPSGGTFVGANNVGEAFSGTIAEILVYDRALGETERRKVEAYLTKKYNLSTVDNPSPAVNISNQTFPPLRALPADLPPPKLPPPTVPPAIEEQPD